MGRRLRLAARYAHTLRHLRPVQTVGRLVVETRRRAGWVRLPDPPPTLRLATAPRVPFIHHDPWNTAEALRAGRVTFLDESRDLGWPIRWGADADAPLLWQFNLQYHAVLPLLAPDERRQLCLDWIAAHPEPEGVAWHPYTTALRIVHWVQSGVASDPQIARSLYRQAAWLLRVREVYHPGNHLLENARALVLAGAALRGQGEADRWTEVGLAIFRHETPTQVLADGGYFERSPMYHALMLVAYGDVLNVTPDAGPWLADAVARLADALASVTHPDGSLPLFNDATEEIAPDTATVLGYAQALVGRPAHRTDALPDTGHFVLRDDDAHVIVDAGPIGPDHLPAHAHADIFTFEASFGGLRFVVDTGVLEYAAGPNRDYDRSTAAHNTVEVDGQSQAECWGSFRVARRFPPKAVSFSERGVSSCVEGAFDGWATLVGDDIAHARSVEIDRDARIVTVDDSVTGEGAHRVVWRLHLHPSVTVRAREGGYLLERDGVTVRLDVTGGDAEVLTSRYSPRFGTAVSRPMIRVVHDGPLPARILARFRY